MASNVSTFRGTVTLYTPAVLPVNIAFEREILRELGWNVVAYEITQPSFSTIANVVIRLQTDCGRDKNQIAANLRNFLVQRGYGTVSLYFDRVDRACPTATEGIGGGGTVTTPTNPSSGGNNNTGGDYVYNAGDLGTVTVSASEDEEEFDLSKWISENQTEVMIGAFLLVFLLRR